jgi:hypothetical protein
MMNNEHEKTFGCSEVWESMEQTTMYSNPQTPRGFSSGASPQGYSIDGAATSFIRQAMNSHSRYPVEPVGEG